MKMFLRIVLTTALIKQVYMQLVSDQSCSPSCLFDEVCVQDCECNPSFYSNADPVQFLKIEPLCTPQQVIINITACLEKWLNSTGFLLPDKYQQGSPCLNSTYRPTAGVLSYVFNVQSGNTACDPEVTINETHVSYSIDVLYKYDTEDRLVILYNDVRVTYVCAYPLFFSSSLSLTAEVMTRMSLFRFSNYTVPYTSSDFPLNMTKDQAIYIEGIGDGTDPNMFSLKVVDCYATLTSNFSNCAKKFIIISSCLKPNTTGVDIVMNGNSTVTRFSIMLFQQVSKNEVYLHCSFAYCEGSCIPQCNARRSGTLYTELHTAGPFILSTP
ncbi:uncharacterized protein LOC122811426 isoform X2 [Protopterus annectens]|uniref:uncharacterized protein LOC122811426 isoform X2 n=1 Tax=Protopterus annectens TaxID=7888 RepID=UPI001CFB4CAC|nr:uncharacterized protein LOC122811426 isoform X2 [Protopterus annectens]